MKLKPEFRLLHSFLFQVKSIVPTYFKLSTNQLCNGRVGILTFLQIWTSFDISFQYMKITLNLKVKMIRTYYKVGIFELNNPKDPYFGSSIVHVKSLYYHSKMKFKFREQKFIEIFEVNNPKKHLFQYSVRFSKPCQFSQIEGLNFHSGAHDISNR